MKTTKDIKQEISVVMKNIKQAESHSDRRNKQLAKKLRADLLKLNQYKLFLESGPTEDSCKRLAERTQDLINKIVDNFTLHYRSVSDAKLKAKNNYLKDRGVPRLRQQLAQLRYLLS